MFQFPTDAAPVSLETIPTILSGTNLTSLVGQNGGRMSRRSQYFAQPRPMIFNCLPNLNVLENEVQTNEKTIYLEQRGLS